MYLEFLLRRAHSRKRVDRKYWSGDSLYSFTTCSNSVTVGVIGPIGSGLPQFGLPRRFAIGQSSRRKISVTWKLELNSGGKDSAKSKALVFSIALTEVSDSTEFLFASQFHASVPLHVS
jgi:hypothetical protein